eukprot:TRINITY_DN1123_c1_g1_i2.p2 TRINITY_DN1123_c1_g1~~TRINITY_DN1123_c1_g1_i2.p2  ORF type:complete len:488 (+),score=191.64 TRINITY_DN1123_c1_g1_i2:82-1545(+)
MEPGTPTRGRLKSVINVSSRRAPAELQLALAENQELAKRERIERQAAWGLGELAVLCHSGAVIVCRKQTLGQGWATTSDKWALQHLDPGSRYVDAVEFGDNDGDAVRMMRQRYGGVDLWINGVVRAQLKQVEYDEKKKVIRARPYRIAVSQIPPGSLRSLLEHLGTLLEKSGVPHNLPQLGAPPPQPDPDPAPLQRQDSEPHELMQTVRDVTCRAQSAEGERDNLRRRVLEVEELLEETRRVAAASPPETPKADPGQAQELKRLKTQLAKQEKERKKDKADAQAKALRAEERVRELQLVLSRAETRPRIVLDSPRAAPVRVPAKPDFHPLLVQARDCMLTLKGQVADRDSEIERLRAELEKLRAEHAQCAQKPQEQGDDAITCAVAAFAGAAMGVSFQNGLPGVPWHPCDTAWSRDSPLAIEGAPSPRNISEAASAGCAAAQRSFGHELRSGTPYAPPPPPPPPPPPGFRGAAYSAPPSSHYAYTPR